MLSRREVVALHRGDIRHRFVRRARADFRDQLGAATILDDFENPFLADFYQDRDGTIYLAELQRLWKLVACFKIEDMHRRLDFGQHVDEAAALGAKGRAHDRGNVLLLQQCETPLGRIVALCITVSTTQVFLDVEEGVKSTPRNRALDTRHGVQAAANQLISGRWLSANTVKLIQANGTLREVAWGAPGWCGLRRRTHMK